MVLLNRFPISIFNMAQNKCPKLVYLPCKLKKEQGSLAIPHSRAYYIASQIQQLGGGVRWTRWVPLGSFLYHRNSTCPALTYLEAGFTHIDTTVPTISFWTHYGSMLNLLWGFKDFCHLPHFGTILIIGKYLSLRILVNGRDWGLDLCPSYM